MNRTLAQALFKAQINRSDNRVSQTYQQRILAIQPSNLLRYYPLSDVVGSPTVADLSGNGGNGSISGSVTLGEPGIGDGNTSALFGGGFINFFSAALAAGFNKDEFTVSVAIKVPAAAWTDGAQHTVYRLRADASNHTYMIKSTVNNVISANRMAGGVGDGSTYTTTGPTAWAHLAFVVSKSGDYARFYLNGSLVGTPGETLNTWTGALAQAVIGAYFTDASAAFSGNMAHFALWVAALSASEVAALASPFMGSVRNLLTVGDSKTGGSGDPTGDGFQSRLCELINAQYSTVYWLQNPPRIGIGGIGAIVQAGSPAKNMAERVDADIAGMLVVPHDILINLGANDISGELVKATWKTNMQYIINAYHAAFPSANIRLAKIWRRDAGDGVIAGRIVTLNEAVDELYAANNWLKTGINEADFLPGSDDGVTNTADGIHPNVPGYALEAAAWKTAMGY